MSFSQKKHKKSNPVVVGIYNEPVLYNNAGTTDSTLNGVYVGMVES